VQEASDYQFTQADMTIYFYDEKELVLIALDIESKSARLLPQALLNDSMSASPAEAATQPSDEVPAAPRTARAKVVKARKGKKGCSICRQPGHNAKTCPKRDGTLPADDRRVAAMSQMTFGRVKIAQSHEIPAATIASNLSVDVNEVEKALKVETYSHYLNR
jgi:hypothetical protein